MNAERSLGRVARLGATVGREQDRVLADQPLADADTILAGVARKNRRVTTRRRMTMAAAVVACVTIAGVGWGVSSGRDRPTETVATPAPAPPPGPRQAGEAKMPLVFQDGTTIVLQPKTRADLHAVRAHGAEMRLDEGVLDVSVVHTEESRWDVLAGPFDVHVTGTKFDARWEPKTQALTIAMREGSVHVTGPCVDEPLAAPHTKTFACPMRKDEAPKPPVPSDVAADAITHSDPPKIATTTKNTDDLETKSAPALVALADEARLGGDTARARHLYELVRRRFPASAEAARCAFLLGRMAEQTAPNDAARAYAEVMRGGGAYAQEAHGRLMELEQRRGDTVRARALAADYLSKFPNGPHHAYATSIEAASP